MKQTTLTFHSVDKMPTDTSKEYLVKVRGGYLSCWLSDGRFETYHDFFYELELIEWAELPECE